MLALPLNDTPPIVLVVARMVAVAAKPDVDWLPVEFTPGRSIFAPPLNDTPPIVLVVFNIFAFSTVPLLPTAVSLVFIVSIHWSTFSLR